LLQRAIEVGESPSCVCAREFAKLDVLFQLGGHNNNRGGAMLHLIWSVIIGFIVGLLARFFYPGAVHLGFLLTVALGIGGSLLGGFIGGLIKRPADGQMFHPAGFIMSIIGACIILFGAHHAGYF
jgi:uncharacterized membrane protein YeaQ/YmgE (transglycosylase-associated protein family)